VTGILEAFWDAYEAIGLNLYNDYSYLEQVWQYHERMVEAICKGDLEAGFQALIEHKTFLKNRSSPGSNRDEKQIYRGVIDGK
jgi:DNA-binding FadR family transcriptional regulator